MRPESEFHQPVPSLSHTIWGLGELPARRRVGSAPGALPPLGAEAWRSHSATGVGWELRHTVAGPCLYPKKKLPDVGEAVLAH